jgi:hypothetical protein
VRSRALCRPNQCSMPLRRSLGYSGLAFQGLPGSGDKPLAATLLHRYTAAVRTQFLRCQILSAVPQIAAMPRSTSTMALGANNGCEQLQAYSRARRNRESPLPGLPGGERNAASDCRFGDRAEARRWRHVSVRTCGPGNPSGRPWPPHLSFAGAELAGAGHPADIAANGPDNCPSRQTTGQSRQRLALTGRAAGKSVSTEYVLCKECDFRTTQPQALLSHAAMATKRQSVKTYSRDRRNRASP